MFAFQFLTSGKVGNRARDAQNTVIGTRAQTEFMNRMAQNRLRRDIQPAEFQDMRGFHLRIAGQPRGTPETRSLNFPGGNHPLADRSAALGTVLAQKFVVGQCGKFHVQINAVQKRTGNLCTVILNLHLTATQTCRRSPRCPHGHGFIAAISMKREGNV